MEKLFGEFSGANYDQWLEQLKKDMKSDDVSKLLHARSEDLEIQSYFSAEQAPEPIFIGPFRKPFNPEFAAANEWEMNVDIATDDLIQSNKQAHEALQHGANSLTFKGIGISNQEELILTLKNVVPEFISLRFDAGEGAPSLLFMLTDEFSRRNINKQKLRGSVTYDILTDYALTGAFPYSKNESFSILEAMISAASEALPMYRNLVVKGAVWHESGATAVQELAFSLSAFNEYFQELGKRISIETLASNARLELASGSDYFLQIAKFRAARILWHMFLEAYGIDSKTSPLEISAVTTLRNKTTADFYNNLLRATTEGMAAVAGGIDTLTVQPHDVFSRESDVNSRRLALNIQHLLHDESRLDKVLDPASGAWYIDALTHELIDRAWNLFQETEVKGGFSAALRSSWIQDQVKASAGDLRKSISTRKRTLVGVSQFADLSSPRIEPPQKQRDPLSKLPEIKTIEPFREAEVIEKIRYYLNKSKSLSAFLAVFGDASKRSARAGFAKDFLAMAGIKSNLGDPSVALLDQLKSSFALKADIVVLCAADEDYASAVELLKTDQWPNGLVWIAGKPSDEIALKKAGIDDFIFLGCDAESIFQKVLVAES
jgi:methylmalonyl-CoA mutase